MTITNGTRIEYSDGMVIEIVKMYYGGVGIQRVYCGCVVTTTPSDKPEINNQYNEYELDLILGNLKDGYCKAVSQ